MARKWPWLAAGAPGALALAAAVASLIQVELKPNIDDGDVPWWWFYTVPGVGLLALTVAAFLIVKVRPRGQGIGLAFICLVLAAAGVVGGSVIWYRAAQIACGPDSYECPF